MRELKVRAWANGYEKWCHNVEYIGDGLWIGYVDDGVGELSTTDIIVEQYTGLKDKNGKEIYEGDIVEALIDGMWSTGRSTVGFGKAKWRLEVLYNDIRFMDVFHIIGSKNCPDRIYYLFDKELSDIEVIGNIHETKLLKEVK